MQKQSSIDIVEQGNEQKYYIGSRRSQAAGIIEVTSHMSWNNFLLWDDIFPKRFNTKPFLILKPKDYLDMRDIKNGLSFINPEIKKFGVYFMNSLKEINFEGYHYILEKCKQASEV